MTSNPMITKEYLRKIHLYCYEDVQEFLAIHKLLEEEMEKPESEMDKDLIEECLNYVEVVMGEDSNTNEETLETKYQEVMAKAAQPQASVPTKIIRGKKRSVRKFFYILAATITILFTALTITAKICGYNNAWEFVYQKAVEIMGLDTGEVIEEENITLIHNGKIEKFASVEDFLERENLNILFPQPLPTTLKIETIRKYCFGNENSNYVIYFNDKNTSLLIRNHSFVDLSTVNHFETHTYESTTYYIKLFPDSTYQAICQSENFEYSITARDYETLMSLIKNMKGANS